MAPGSIFHHISFRSTILFSNLLFLESFTFRSINEKPKNIYFIFCLVLSIFIRSHFCKWPWRDWQPLYRVGCKLFDCLCRYWWFVRCLLLDWYLGSLTKGDTYLYFAASPFPRQGKNNASSRSSRENCWRCCRGDLRQVKTYQVPIINLSSLALHYSPFASRFPLPHF